MMWSSFEVLGQRLWPLFCQVRFLWHLSVGR